MEFGRMPYEGLTETDFVFAKREQPFLPGKRVAEPKLYIGLSKWNHEKWEGKLYPPKTKAQDTLTHYARQFNVVELNATHYHIPTEEQVKKWAARVEDEGFRFCPKFSKLISHQGGAKVETKSQLTDSFIQSISAFGDKLGPCFLQLSDHVVSNSKSNSLMNYLEYLPIDLSVFLEVRHPSWFESDETIRAFAKELNQRNKGWVITDTAGRRDAAHMQLSIPSAFVRFVCIGETGIDLFRVQQWKEQLKEWYSTGLEACYFFLHIYNEDESIDFAKYIQTELAEALKP